MFIPLDIATLATGLLVFVARVVDVSVGTMRTISIVNGMMKAAFALGLVEVTIWLLIVSTVIHKISAAPILIVFYAFGFSTGNVVGIMLERWVASGSTILRVITTGKGNEMSQEIRAHGYPVTTFLGEGMSGPVTLLYVVCRRKDLRHVLCIVRSFEKDAFYITERVGGISKILYPAMQPLTGWRAIFKKK